MDFADAVALDPGYEDLVAQGIALLPAHAPEWTNHNASDPGITLIELLAYFTDALLYRLGRVGTAEHVEFLRLLHGDAAVDDALDHFGGRGASAVRDAIHATVDEMAQLDCAVTLDDHERLALQALSSHPDGTGTQVRCLARTDLTRAALTGRAGADVAADAAHVTVVVLAPAGTSRDVEASLMRTVRDALAARRLLTSHVHVVAPVLLYLGVRLATTVGARADREALAAAIAESFDAWTPRAVAGGTRGATYTLALTEIADRAAAVDGVDGIDAVQLLQASNRRETVQDTASAIGYQVGRRSTIGRDRLGGPSSSVGGRLVRDADGELAAIALQPWEAPRVVVRPQDIAWSDAR